MKKSEIFVNKIEGDIGNNQKLCDVDEQLIIEEDNIEKKLDKLFNTNGYIFNIKVKIITDDKTYDTRIASRIGDNLITLDNNIIKISDIKDIVF